MNTNLRMNTNFGTGRFTRVSLTRWDTFLNSLTWWDTFLSVLVGLLIASCETTQYAIQPQTSRIVFRVRGIPYGINLSSISFALLHSPPLPTIREFEDITVDINESTLVPDCYNTCTQMQMALIQFIPRPPDYLQRLQTNETYSLRLDGSREEITIDKDFFGHTQLYPTTGQIAAERVTLFPPYIRHNVS